MLFLGCMCELDEPPHRLLCVCVWVLLCSEMSKNSFLLSPFTLEEIKGKEISSWFDYSKSEISAPFDSYIYLLNNVHTSRLVMEFLALCLYQKTTLLSLLFFIACLLWRLHVCVCVCSSCCPKVIAEGRWYFKIKTCCIVGTCALA